MKQLLLLLPLLIASIGCLDLDPLSDEYLDYLQQQDIPWKAGRNFDKDTNMEDIKRLLGVKSDGSVAKPATKVFKTRSNDMPESFDAREAWPNCESIKTIRDQSNCGSCWAFAAVEAMSDRICIHTDQQNQTQLSAADLLSCCEKCGDGCDGGYPAAAWEYWFTHGLVAESCQPYPFESCGHHVNSKLPNCSTLESYDTPKCSQTCSSKDDEREIILGSRPYAINSIEEDIQREILVNGPVEASFDVFDDFLSYQSGVYTRTEGAKGVGGHAVKIIGWGVEEYNNETVKYWLIANSWNEYWGDGGFFKMLRGENECGIESNIVAGLPFNWDMPNGATNVAVYFGLILAGVLSLIFL